MLRGKEWRARREAFRIGSLGAGRCAVFSDLGFRKRDLFRGALIMFRYCQKWRSIEGNRWCENPRVSGGRSWGGRTGREGKDASRLVRACEGTFPSGLCSTKKGEMGTDRKDSLEVTDTAAE